ncbi:MAG: hypothetical protein FJ110_02730 [Deltaproteobacteria bacterium]|nr:hypothetical protein [Deltaproteobacteria bacterium]
MEHDKYFDFLDEFQKIESASRPSGPVKELSEPKEQIIPNERIAFLLFPFFIDLIDQFKDKLKEIRNFTRTHHNKCGDKDFIALLSQMLADELKKTDLVQTNLLNYIRINNPILKTDTIITLLEEELEKCRIELETGKIRLFKKLEKNLPETAIPDDQLRYIFNCLLQYVFASAPSGGAIGLYTRSLGLQKETGEPAAPGPGEEKQIEILMVYTDNQKTPAQIEPALGVSARQKKGILDLTLRLADEVVRKNRGVMKFEEDEKKQKTTISLRFPVERRKVVYYRPSSKLGPGPFQPQTTFEKLSSLDEKGRKGA